MMDRDGWKARIHEVRAGARQRQIDEMYTTIYLFSEICISSITGCQKSTLKRGSKGAAREDITVLECKVYNYQHVFLLTTGTAIFMSRSALDSCSHVTAMECKVFHEVSL